MRISNWCSSNQLAVCKHLRWWKILLKRDGDGVINPEMIVGQPGFGVDGRKEEREATSFTTLALSSTGADLRKWPAPSQRCPASATAPIWDGETIWWDCGGAVRWVLPNLSLVEPALHMAQGTRLSLTWKGQGEGYPGGLWPEHGNATCCFFGWPPALTTSHPDHYYVHFPS